MKVPIWLFQLGAVSLIAIAAAAPLTAQRRAHHESHQLARGSTSSRRTRPPYLNNPKDKLHLNASRKTEYSSNWAGAVLIGSGYTAVTAEFVVPTPKVPQGGSSGKQYCASAWVGIDGDTCGTAILQTGLDFCVQDNSVSYGAWYEWYPDYAYDFSDFGISAGNFIRVTVDATSKKAGTATVENLSTGQSVQHTFNGDVNGDLCEYNAEWIVEDFEANNSLVPFANFDFVYFYHCQATNNGSTVGVSGATLIDIKQNDRLLTFSLADKSTTVQVWYVGDM